jgi:hypothetical protein
MNERVRLAENNAIINLVESKAYSEREVIINE